MVFVTGATGLIGGYLLLELSKRGKEIRAMKRKDSSLDAILKLFEEFSTLEKFNEIEWAETDLLDIPSLSSTLHGIQTIYHTAGCVGFDDRQKELIHQINVQGTENLVNIAISQNIPEFLYISSIAALDNLPGENKIDESSKWNTEKDHSEYAISKKKGEMAVWRGSQEGLNVVVVYPSVVVGSLDGKRASEKIFKLATKKKMFATDGITGYIDVRDVAFCMAELVERKRWNESYILTSQDKSFSAVFDFIRSKMNLPKIQVLSENKLKLIRKISLISRFFGGKYMSKPSYDALTGRSIYSNEKIKNETGIEFIPVIEALNFHFERFNNLKSGT